MSIYPTKFQVNTVTNIEFILKNGFCQAEFWLFVSVVTLNAILFIADSMTD